VLEKATALWRFPNTGHQKIILWDNIKNNPPTQLKISPIATIPHKLRSFRSILDLSFSLRLKNGGILPSVNDTTIKTAPTGALNQLGHALSRIIHAFAESDDIPDAKIFMAKWGGEGWILENDVQGKGGVELCVRQASLRELALRILAREKFKFSPRRFAKQATIKLDS
jgi:hypothetical protein